MKTYKFDNATIHVDGEVSKEHLKKATIRFFKNIRKNETNKKEKALWQQ